MMKWLLVSLFIFGTFSLSAEESPDKYLKSALKCFQDAETKIRKGINDEAFVLLTASVIKLQELRYDYPDWNSSVIRNRISLAKKRINDVELLILSNISFLSRDQLILRLKETQIAKAKLFEDNMIIHEKLKNTALKLNAKEKYLEEARQAAGSKLISNAKMDKLTFENLKLKKSLKEKEASLVQLRKSLEMIRKGNGTDAIIRNLEEQYTALQKREKILLLEKARFMKEKHKLLNQLKVISFKYANLFEKEKHFDARITTKNSDIKTLGEALTKELENRKLAEIAAEEASSKLRLAEKRIVEYESNEKSIIGSLEDKVGGVKGALMNHKNNNAMLVKEINRLRQIEIDLISKNKRAIAESEKNKARLLEYMNSSARSSKTKLQTEVDLLKKMLTSKNRDLEKRNSVIISLNSENASMKAQIKLQKNIISDIKMKETAKVSFGSGQMTEAYGNNESDLKEKLKFTQEKLASLEKINKFLKEENITGDKELIRKYIKVRDELKLYKSKLKIVGKEGGLRDIGILEEAKFDREVSEKEKIQKIQEFLLQAQNAEKLGKVQVAIGLYSEILKLDRQNFDALLRIGFLHFSRHHFHDAKVHLKKAWYIEPDHPELLLALGVSELELNNLEMAVSSLSRLVGMHPKNVNARVQLGTSLQGLGWTDAAFLQLKKACELDVKNAGAAFNFAVVCLSLPEPKIKVAEAHYERAVKLGIVRDPVLDKFFNQL